MSASYTSYHPEQQLLPSALQDWLPQGYLAYFINDTSSDVQQLPMVLAAVKAYTGLAAGEVFADAGYRSETVMAELARTQSDTELVIALGREGSAWAPWNKPNHAVGGTAPRA